MADPNQVGAPAQPDPTRARFLSMTPTNYFRIWNNDTPNCLPYVASSMMTMITRQVGDDQNIELSPQALFNRCYTLEHLIWYLTNNGLGLEAMDGRVPDPSIMDFVYTHERRYTIHDLTVQHTMEDKIGIPVSNFGPGGMRYPLIAACYHFGRFAYPSYAARCTAEDPCDCLGVNQDPNADGHAMLITGIYTLADNPTPDDYSIQVRDVKGENWGVRGHAWTKIDLIYCIVEPVVMFDANEEF